MPGHDQTDVRRRRLASTWLLIVASLVAPATWPASGFGQEAPVARWQGDEADSIRLKADHVQTWTEGETLWVLLEDQAEIGQGDVSIRSRTGRGPGHAGGAVGRLDLPGRGLCRRRRARPGRPRQDPSGCPHAPDHPGQAAASKPGLRVGESQLTGPPRGLPILARAFPKPAEAKSQVRTEPAAKAEAARPATASKPNSSGSRSRQPPR